MILLSLALITVPFIVTGTLTYLEYTERLEAIAGEYGTIRLRQFALNLERYLREMERLSLAPLYDQELLEVLKTHAAPDAGERQDYEYQDFQTLQAFLVSLQFDRNELRTVRLYTLDRMVFSYADYYASSRWSREDEGWMSVADRLEGRAILLPPRRYSYDQSDERKLISYVRLLREPFSFHPVGYVKIDLTTENFSGALMPEGIAERYPLFVYNQQDELIFPEGLDRAAFVLRDNLIEYNGELHAVSEYRHRDSGLTIYGLIPYRNIRHEAQTVTARTAGIALVSLAAAYFLAILFSNRLIRPLLHLTDQVHRVRDGDYEARVSIESRDEIGDLGRSFNAMAVEIQRLIHQVLHVTVQEQEAEIMLLQNQMNPHFLYNTLEMINMMAVVREQPEISEIVLALSRLLRYSLSGFGREAVLEEELQFVANYCRVQERRLGDRFRLRISVPEDVRKFRVPRLLLQPFAENCIEHGLKAPGTVLQITAVKERNRLRILIEDNGNGFSAEKRLSLQQSLQTGIDVLTTREQVGRLRKGVALRNIHQRLRLMYGERYGLVINESEKGARFELLLPLIEKSDDA